MIDIGRITYITAITNFILSIPLICFFIILPIFGYNIGQLDSLIPNTEIVSFFISLFFWIFLGILFSQFFLIKLSKEYYELETSERFFLTVFTFLSTTIIISPLIFLLLAIIYIPLS